MNKKRMLINAVEREEKRMAIIADSKLSEFNIQMSAKEPISGNIYKGIIMKVERGLQAAFVDYSGKKNGFLPLHDVHSDYFEKREEGDNNHKHKRPGLKIGQQVLVQVQREEKDRKGAMLTTLISLPGRYLVLMPNRPSIGVSRKIEDETDRKRLKDMIDQINKDESMGLIIRTAGMSRKKQELSRDYQQLLRLWETIEAKSESTKAPALIYQESDFGVKSLRDYLNPDIHEILVDDVDTFKKMRDYMKTVQPRNVNMIKLYKEKVPLFDKFKLEEQINEVYQERVNLKSGGYIIISPTEAMITIDVNSGRASNKKDVEETAFRANLEAAEEIARQLRLRDLGGLIVIDFIDMKDKRHNSELEKAFKKALSFDRARIQLSKISKFGIIELSRQKKQSTIQEISFKTCAHCKGSGLIPSIEYTALGLFRKIKSEIVKETHSCIKVIACTEVAEYLLNQKRTELAALEETHDTSVYICSDSDLHLGESRFEFVKREDKEAPVQKLQRKKAAPAPSEALIEVFPETEREETTAEEGVEEETPAEAILTPEEPARKKSRRRTRRRRKKGPKPAEGSGTESSADAGTEAAESEPAEEEKTEANEETAQQEIVLLPAAEPAKVAEPPKKKSSEKPELPSVISKIYDLFS
ncbi:MAG: Rne/Rng family ribonuclease [Syntrophaceae bacterium]